MMIMTMKTTRSNNKTMSTNQWKRLYSHESWLTESPIQLWSTRKAVSFSFSILTSTMTQFTVPFFPFPKLTRPHQILLTTWQLSHCNVNIKKSTIKMKYFCFFWEIYLSELAELGGSNRGCCCFFNAVDITWTKQIATKQTKNRTKTITIELRMWGEEKKPFGKFSFHAHTHTLCMRVCTRFSDLFVLFFSTFCFLFAVDLKG